MDPQQCPLCLMKGKTAPLQWQSLDFERKILLCLSSECTFPFGTKFFDDCLRQKANNFQYKTNQRLWQRKNFNTFVSEDKTFIHTATSDAERKTPSDVPVMKESNIYDITSENYSPATIENRNEASTEEICNTNINNVYNLKEISTCNRSITLTNASSCSEFNTTSDLRDLENPRNLTNMEQNEKVNLSENINCNQHTSSSNDLQTEAKIVNDQVTPNNCHHNHQNIHCFETNRQDLELNALLSVSIGNSTANRSACQRDNKIDAVIEREKRKPQKIPNSTIKYKPYDVGASNKQYKKTADRDNCKKGSSLLKILDRSPLARMSRENINLTDLPEKMLNEVLKEKSIQDRSRQDKLSPKTSASDGNLTLHTKCDIDDTTYGTCQASPADSGFSSLPDSSANTPPITNNSNNLIIANSQFLEELDALLPDITEEVLPISNIG